MFELLLIANAVWFGLGFHLFALRNQVFARILVTKEHRDSPAFHILAESGKFLGGFNLALCALNVFLLFQSDLFPAPAQRMVLCAFFALAHGSQFYFNLPIALANRKGKGVWRVQGLMRFIFITDFLLMAANGLVAVIFFLAP